MYYSDYLVFTGRAIAGQVEKLGVNRLEYWGKRMMYYDKKSMEKMNQR